MLVCNGKLSDLNEQLNGFFEYSFCVVDGGL